MYVDTRVLDNHFMIIAVVLGEEVIYMRNMHEDDHAEMRSKEKEGSLYDDMLKIPVCLCSILFNNKVKN